MSETLKVASNNDGDLSSREKRKSARKSYSEAKKNNFAHDDSGTIAASEKDLCDCLNDECPGCHFPCPKCRSCKCGLECRANRKWVYEEIENEVTH